MKNRIIKILALSFVALSTVTCGDGSSKAAVSATAYDHQIERDVDIYKYSCDISVDGMVVYVKSTNEILECRVDEFLEDFGWIPRQ